jgi:hypothetical protein
MLRALEISCLALIVALVLYVLIHHVHTLWRGAEGTNPHPLERSSRPD